MNRKLVTRFASGTAAAALALGAVACDMDDNGDLSPGQEEPTNDVEGDAGLEDHGLEDEGLDEEDDLGDDY